jgi:hypothetical protein
MPAHVPVHMLTQVSPNQWPVPSQVVPMHGWSPTHANTGQQLSTSPQQNHIPTDTHNLPHAHSDSALASPNQHQPSSPRSNSFSPFHSDVYIPTSPKPITGSPRIRSNVSPQLGILQRRASLRTHSPLSLSSASLTPPDWEMRMGMDNWGLDGSIAKLGEEKNEDERRKEEAQREEEKLEEEDMNRAEEKAKEQAEKERQQLEKGREREKAGRKEGQEDSKHVVFQRTSSPPTPPSLKKPSESMYNTPPSPGRRLASSAMTVKVRTPVVFLLPISHSM